MFCDNIISDGPQSAFVLLCFVFNMFTLMCLVTVSRRAVKKKGLVYSFFLLMCLVLALILITMVPSRRYSVPRVWSDGKTHCSDKPLPFLLLCCALLPQHRQEKPMFFVDLRKRRSVFLDPQRNKQT